MKLQVYVGTRHAVQVMRSSKPVQVKRWTHVTATCDGQLLQLFIDGGLDAKVMLERQALCNNDSIVLGKCVSGLNGMAAPFNKNVSQVSGFTGQVKDVRWYLRDLEQGEVSQDAKAAV